MDKYGIRISTTVMMVLLLQLEKNLFLYYRDLLAIRFTYIKSTGKKSIVLSTSCLKEAVNLSNSRSGSMVHEAVTSLIMLSTILHRSLDFLLRDCAFARFARI